MGCVSLSRPSGRVGSNDPLSLSSTESSPTSHAKSQRPSNPNRFPMCATVAIGTQIETRIDRPIASQCAPPWPSEPRSKAESSNQSLPDVRHRGDRNPDLNQNRSFNRCPTCATVAMGTQTESRIEQPIASRCAPPWPSEPNRYPMCATVAIGTQIESRIDEPNASRCAPPWLSIPRSKPESIAQSLPEVRHRGPRNPDQNQHRSGNRMPTRTENRHRNRSKIDAKSIPKGSK